MKPLLRLLAAGVATTALVASCILAPGVGAQTVGGPINVTGTIQGVSNAPIVAGPLTGQNSCTFQENAAKTAAGPVDANVSVDGVNWTAATISNMSGTTQSQPVTPTLVTTYQITPTNATYVEIVPDSTWGTQNVVVTMHCSISIAALPSAGGGGGSSTVTCASPGCVVTTPAPYVAPTCPAAPNAPCVQLTGPPAPQPSPLYTMPVTTPAPAPTTTGGWLGAVGFNVGSGVLFQNTICDTFSMSGAISSATTTQLIAGVANENIYICLAAWQTTGTNASNTINFEYGQGATCGTNTQTLFPGAVAPDTVAGGWVSGWGGSQILATSIAGMPAPAAQQLIVPANATAYNFCGVTAGTTTAGKFVVWYAIH